MQNLYENTQELDNRACALYGLEPSVLMENAAARMRHAVVQRAGGLKKVLIVCGGGDNGGDGYALARHLSDLEVQILSVKEPKSALCQIQYQRALACHIEVLPRLELCQAPEIVVDCLFGSGFKGRLSQELQELLNALNALSALKIACDVPSGLDAQGFIESIAFRADVCVVMGALKSGLFSDMAKDFVGEVVVANLGVGRDLYETESPLFLLEKNDLVLPLRTKQNTHKGYFGHVGVVVGAHCGAGFLSAKSALAFGAGLVSVLGASELQHTKPLEIMYAPTIPSNISALALGMGLEGLPENLESMLELAPCVLDAGVFYDKRLLRALDKPYQMVLTPHPKEFLSLLHMLGYEVQMPELLRFKLKWAHAFSQAYPHVVLLLKGANPIIAYSGQMYINPLGSSALAKAGSGDILSGMVAALLAQGYSLLDATIHASLAHALAGSLNPATYALTPQKLLDNLAAL
ncbi:NAD(P)HX epimerase / NAD(P)HX dehydratase [Helicobacter heilmannii]|uniref:Bifunctional NAD(P)H-hydrate repair enzyme n=2 Tax=Helicobacter heilmannii TaxID=35817 RepID=A0A0K2XZ54_HELHE|nr:bifunctional ADP-dependent NAD(P)H-hydrate dehydratase/NAD(P)H-hydrate epimerase [Helicobacter heilmannii]CCM11998.1 NAD(P)HX epimerase / NAD(P)HX dehydratase [Helicobacter heilmannii ASB1.4]CRF45979.1 NAD(P)HX epimerase / NAD(P)HX dehydratase [Helicobacter heilmannii]CRF48151.1 NAD(P)HX epimerase / NAD(P)HX dehydratase [Helicobacter heilmannii]CRF51347.1 NAD(P)HX epimerase / NAD(P)HX dehydratase [Helicobacter heilmannii]CRI34369.1 NAD(P)HX epimerase / NAD(P)HX dehydratase [Helicobacter hei